MEQFDIENEIFGTIAPVIRETFTSAFITGESIKNPSQFPHVSIIQRTTTNCPRSFSLKLNKYIESAMCDYEVMIYSNLQAGRKAQCKEIRSVIDAEFFKIGFNRVSSEYPPCEDVHIIIMKLHYQGIISEIEPKDDSERTNTLDEIISTIAKMRSGT